MKLITTLLLITSINSLNINDCNEVGKYKDKFIFICSQELTASINNENISPSPTVPSPVENISPSPTVPSPVENISPSPTVPSPVENISPSPTVPSPVENISPSPTVPSPVENIYPSPTVPSPVENISPSPTVPSPSSILKDESPGNENTQNDYLNFNTIGVDSINQTKNETKKTEPKKINETRVWIIILPICLVLLISLPFMCKVFGSKYKNNKICDSSKLGENEENESVVTDETNESPPRPPSSPPPSLPTPPLYDIENPPPVPPRSNFTDEIIQDQQPFYDIDNPPPVPPRSKNNVH